VHYKKCKARIAASIKIAQTTCFICILSSKTKYPIKNPSIVVPEDNVICDIPSGNFLRMKGNKENELVFKKYAVIV
jgi:hypothetical protein